MADESQKRRVRRSRAALTGRRGFLCARPRSAVEIPAAGRPGIISAVYDSPRTNNNLVGVYRLQPPEIRRPRLPSRLARPTHCINNEWRQPNFHCYIISYGLHTPRPPLYPVPIHTVHSHTRVKQPSLVSLTSAIFHPLSRSQRKRERFLLLFPFRPYTISY